MSATIIAALALGAGAIGAAYAITAAAEALGRHDVNGMPFHQAAGDRDAERLGRGDERAAVHDQTATQIGARHHVR